jgi:hypothetical protein
MFVIEGQIPVFTPLVVDDVGDPVARPAAMHAAASHFWTAPAAEQARSFLTHVRTRRGRTTTVEVLPVTRLRECACQPEALRRGPRSARRVQTDPESLSLF